MSLKDNYDQIQKVLEAHSSVKLIGVSKYATNEQIQEAYGLGIRNFGENYIVPALKKRKELNLPNDVIWHLLGPIQKNKLNKVVGNFDLIHSVHTREIAELINKKAKELDIVQDILLQVDLTDDKSGFKEDELEETYLQLSELLNINIKGLMLMNFHQVSQKSETNFKSMRHLLKMMSSHHSDLLFELSMGMTNDYHLAVKHGSTMVRLGRGLFGEK